MFPSHCKEVSFKHVDFDLTPENIKSFLKGKKAYIRTRYYIFNSGEHWAVVLIVRKGQNEVLQDIASVHILSLPHETSFVEDPSMDVLSASMMGAIREAKGTKCVVVRGKAEHISFFIDEPPYELTIFDVVPPSPSKLLSLVNGILESDLQSHYVKVRCVSKDLGDLKGQVKTGTVMYPCRASGLAKDRNALFLDETPVLTQAQLEDLTLVGCSLSARIFEAIYGLEPVLVNMCPQDLVQQEQTSGPVLVKCCKVKEGHQVVGKVGIVPWGARASEVRDALIAILR